MSRVVGTRHLVRLDLRLDRVRLGLLIGGLAVMMVGIADSFDSLYPTAAGRQEFAADMNDSAAIRALYGPAYGSSIGALTAWRWGVPGAVIAAMVCIFIVVRHTRADEENGRRELLGATVVGRHAPLTAALVVIMVANLALAGAVALAMIAVGEPLAGSLALGLALAAGGLVFSGVAAVTAQVTESSRTANSIAMGALGLAFLVRIAADAATDSADSTPWYGWLSPIGWTQQVRPYAGDRWWVLGLVVAAFVGLAALAYTLEARRDVDAGILAARRGPAEGPRWLKGPWGLAWRLQWGSLVGWTVGLAAYGAVIGAVADSAADIVEDNPDMADMVERLGGTATLTDSFMAASLGFLGFAAAGYCVQAALRLRSEETSGRAEPVLATAATRLRWAGSHLTFALLGPAVALGVAGLAAGVAYGLSVGDVGGKVPRVLAGALVQLPAVWVLGSIALLLFGLLPERTVLSWGALLAVVVIGFVGEILDLGQWFLDLSPFTHIPRIPGGTFTALPLVLLIAVAATLSAVGLAGVRRRDLD